MKKLMFAFALTVLFSLFCSGLSDGELTKQEEISLFIQDAMIEYYVPGVSVAVIRDYEIEWALGYGETDIETGNPVTERTLFQAASISKPVAAMAALKFAQEGIIDLDSDVNDYLRSWKIPDNEYTEANPVTLQHLLSHTGGLTVHGFRGYRNSEDKPSVIQILNGEKPANSAPIRVNMVPGKEYRRSGGGYTIVQQALVDLAGKPFPAIMRKTVLSKLEMDYSTYEQPLSENLLKFAAAGHRDNGEPIIEKRHIYPEMAAAGLWTTASDLARFAIEIQKSIKGESNRVLSQDMSRLMITPYISENYGMGLQIVKRGDRDYFAHDGSNEGFRCFILASVNGGFGAVIMTNGARGSQLYREIIDKIEEVYEWQEIGNSSPKQ